MPNIGQIVLMLPVQMKYDHPPTTSNVVNTAPGWLLEANGILHPRGSEYQVQYVVDGLPITDNRSPSFAPELDADGVHSMSILTGGYPAEYGRKLGGVIEVVTAANPRQGLHGCDPPAARSWTAGRTGGHARARVPARLPVSSNW